MTEKSIKAEGDGSLAAGRDINITQSYRIDDQLKNELSKINDRVNDMIGPIISPKHNSQKQTFNSGKIIRSLAIMGVPVEAGLQVLNMIIGPLEVIKEKENTITTFHIRKVVSNALYNLDAKEYSIKTIENWGTSYARRYGNPNVRIRVVHSDGSEEPLDFKYIKNSVIPEIIEKCYDGVYSELKNTFLINSSVVEMAEEIFDKVKNLGLYNVYIKTLLNLAYDIATQPPQPWFVNEKYKEFNIKYDIERAERHFKIISNPNEEDSKDEIRHSCVDCVDHISSAILTKYDLFIGAGRLKPLTNLINFLNLSNDNKGNTLLWEKSKLEKIEGDLYSINYTLLDILRKLKKHKELLGDRVNNLKHLIESSKLLYKIGLGLLSQFNQAEEQYRILIEPKTTEDYKNAVRYFFSFILKSKEVKAQIPCSLSYYFPFSFSMIDFVTNKVKVILHHPTFNPVDDINKVFKNRNYYDRESNCTFIVTNSNKFELAQLIECSKKKHKIFYINSAELFNLAHVKSRSDHMFELICK